jgi:DegV family protein with EDD domain
MLRIVMDGAGDMPDGWAQDFDIKTIPINIQIKDKTYLQYIELSNDKFYSTVEEIKEIPKTSQPTPQQFVEFYQSIANLGDTILSLHVTSKLSGTFTSALIAARELLDKYHIVPIDSGSGSAALGFMCREARLMDRAGESLQSILDRMQFIRDNISVVLTMENLEYARMSGRVKAIQAALASALNVKPIVILRDGMLHMAEKVRTRQKAVEKIIDTIRQQVGDRMVNVAVVHARDPEMGRNMIQLVKEKLNAAEIVVTDLSIGVAANLGPGTVGIVAYPLKEGA